MINLPRSIDKILILSVSILRRRRSLPSSRKLFLNLQPRNHQIQRIQQQLRHRRGSRTGDSMAQSRQYRPATDGIPFVGFFLDSVVEGESVLVGVLSGMEGEERGEVSYELSIKDGVCGFLVCHVCLQEAVAGAVTRLFRLLSNAVSSGVYPRTVSSKADTLTFLYSCSYYSPGYLLAAAACHQTPRNNVHTVGSEAAGCICTYKKVRRSYLEGVCRDQGTGREASRGMQVCL